MRKLLLLAVVVLSTPALARDWFVRAGATGGDGSLQKPFADPWQPLEKCEAGDSIHVAEGKYFGKNSTAQWKVTFDNVSLLGGYDKDFKERNPWKHPTQLRYDEESKNWPKEDRFISTGDNTTFDGFVIDQQDQCAYQDEEKSGRREKPCDNPLKFWLPATIRNNIIINPGLDGIVACAGSVIENNIVVNALEWAIVVNSHATHSKKLATIKNNTLLFSWSFGAPAQGKYDGSGIGLKAPALVTQNIIANMDNNGIYMPMEAEKNSITKNVFWMNHWSNLKHDRGANSPVVDDQSMDTLDEIGLKAFDGNEVKDPGLAIDAAWMDKYSQRTAAIPGKVDMDEWNKARQVLGLPLLGKGYKSPTGVAPPYSVESALKLVTPKVSQGAHVVELPVKFSAVADAAPARDYKPAKLADWAKSPQEGKAFEMTVAVAGVANASGIPSSYDSKDYAATKLYEADGSVWVLGFYKKGSAVQRKVDEVSGWYQGNGKTERVYVVRGVASPIPTIPKAAFLIESIEDSTGPALTQVAVGARPVGRDWFVRAGSAGGDGSKEKPFKDPWQALEKVEAGDSVHVTEGEYNGKLKMGAWRISMPYVALIGGYSKDFKTRNPWKMPSVLRTAAEYKTYQSDYIIQGENDHTGAIVDGFVFDKTTVNKYKPDGDLDFENSPKMDHLWFARPGCIVRNNVFVNSAERAIRAAGGQTYENNIIVNSNYLGIAVDSGFGGLTQIRNNTFAFAWESRFGQGHGNPGTLLALGGRVQAVVDNNIFEFADNDAVKISAASNEVSLTRNVFSHNLWSHVYMTDGPVFVDDKSWKQLSDIGFKKNEGNVLMSPGLPIDQKWFDTYLNRTAYVAGKVQMDDWNQLRELLGQPVLATGGKAGSGRAPNLDWKLAINLFPKNAKVTAGARASDLPVVFGGKAPEAGAAQSYDEVDWVKSAKDKDTWAALDGKRVTMKVVIRDPGNSYLLDDVKKDDYADFTIFGPLGDGSGGLPMHVYVKRGTKHERVMNDAKSYRSGDPDQTYIVRGVARSNRCLVIESIERAD